MGRYFGREPRYSRQEIEVQAKQELEARMSMGRPPAEDFLPIEARLAERDRAMAARAPVVAKPAPPARRRQQHADIAVTEVRLPAAAKAGKPPATRAGQPATARAKATTVVATPKARAPRPPVAAKEH